MRLRCPHCRLPGVPALSKLLIGPGKPARCAECGASCGVPLVRTWLSLAPFLLGVLASAALRHPVAAWAAGALGFAGYLATFLGMVPLQATPDPRS